MPADRKTITAVIDTKVSREKAESSYLLGREIDRGSLAGRLKNRNNYRHARLPRCEAVRS